MTENPNETFCSTQFYNQIKRELTNSPCTNDVALGFYNNGINVDNSTASQLTDSHLKYNVHIVLENLKRSVEKTYLHDNANNNNTTTNNNGSHNTIISTTTTNNNQNNYHQRSSHTNTSAVNNQTTKFGNNGTTTVDNSQTISKVKNAAAAAAANTFNKAGENMSSPESDCNSNVHANHMQQLASSIASSHDFTHDNSDYQWFLDYK